MTGITASWADQVPFLESPRAYATPMWVVRTKSSPLTHRQNRSAVRRASTDDSQVLLHPAPSRVLPQIKHG